MRYAQKKRGSALLMTLILSMALASTVLYAVSDTLNASVNSRREDNYARALAAAEYGAELAIAEIGNGVSADGTSAGAKVDGDFVVGSATDPAKSTLYDNGAEAVDQRRITGTYGEQEFRVRVRSARQVYGNPEDAVARTLIESGWLKAPENADKELTELKAYEFRDTYEITSTARNETVAAGGRVPGELATSPVVQAIVTFDYNNAVNKMLADTGLIHGEDSGNFQVTDESDAESEKLALTVSSSALANIAAPFTGDNITITGEDHYLINYHNDTVTLGKQIQPMKLKTGEPNYFGATGMWWEEGKVTYHYKQVKNPENNGNLIARDKEAVNPYRPRTRNFGTGDNQTMFVKDKNEVYDMYLLGGKSANGKGLTVTVVDQDKEYNRSGVKGKIEETQSSQAGPGADFDIVLPRFEDLRNMYINVASDNVTQTGDWKQMYVGQYTTEAKSSSGGNIREASVPLLYGTKIRPQSVHTVRNADKQILVRLYAGPVKKDGTRDYYKYPKTPKYEIRDVYELYELNGFNENHANVLNAYASDPAGGKNKKNLDAALKTGDFVERDDKYWMESDNQYTVKHPVTGKTRTAKIWFEFRSCAKGQSDYGDKYYGNFWAVDAGTGAAMEEPQSGFKDLSILVPVYVGQKPVLTEGNEWTGYYIWADASFNALNSSNKPITGNTGKNGSGFILDFDPDPKKESWGELTVGRIFPWQEIVGYSLVKRTDNGGSGEPKVLSTVGGWKDKNDNRTYYADAKNQQAMKPGDRVPTGFDEVYQASAEKLKNHDNMTYKPDWDSNDKVINLADEYLRRHPLFKEKSLGYLKDRNDPIRVLMLPEGTKDVKGIITGYTGYLGSDAWSKESKEYDELYKKDGEKSKNYNKDSQNDDLIFYRTMEDFKFKKEFNIVDEENPDAESDPVILSTANIMGGYEDSDNYDYVDLMFTVYVASYDLETDANVVARTSLPWWERDEVEGLTGDKARGAVSFNNQVTSDIELSSGEILSGNFQRVGSKVGQDGRDTNLSTRVWTMANGNGRGFADFPRAVFDTSNGDFKLDTKNDRIAAYFNLLKEKKITDKPVFYFTDADAMDWVMQLVANGEDVGELEADREKVNARFVEHFSADYDFRHIDERYGLDSDRGTLAEVLTKEKAEFIDGEPSSLAISRNEVFVREIAGAFAGYKTYSVPEVKTENYLPINGAEATNGYKSFLAGEPVPESENGRLSFGGDTVPLRSDALEITGDTKYTEDRGGRRIKWLNALDETGVYADSFAVHPRENFWNTFGMKEMRASIGYHRGGDTGDVDRLVETGRVAEADKALFLDRYEGVYLAPTGENFFRLSNDGSAVAQELQNPGTDADDAIYASEFTYSGNELATYVIDKPLDGAGTMVVNGNLIVADTFAYHGILVVTGDLIIRPTLKKDRFNWSIDGWPLDAYGHRLIPIDLNRGLGTADLYAAYGADYDKPDNWFYLPDGMKGVDVRNITQKKAYQQLDGRGEPLRDKATREYIPVMPVRVDEYRGELALQGKLMVKGRIITETVDETEIDEAGVETVVRQHTGVLNAYWSQKAVDAMAGMFPLGKPTVQRVSWTHNDDIRTDSIWKDTQETVKEVTGDKLDNE